MCVRACVGEGVRASVCERERASECVCHGRHLVYRLAFLLY